jgi:hypothetical protein
MAKRDSLGDCTIRLPCHLRYKSEVVLDPVGCVEKTSTVNPPIDRLRAAHLVLFTVVQGAVDVSEVFYATTTPFHLIR